MRGLLLVFILGFGVPAVADDAATEVRETGIHGLSIPASFERNLTLSVAGQLVFEHINDAMRDLVAITPGVRQGSIDMLMRRGYQDFCLPQFGLASRILFHRNAHGLTWLVIGQQRTAHIVLANESPHLEHFHQEILALCEPVATTEPE